MNWEAISAIGEITGALAVVITLGYFGIQVRAAREAAADTNRLHRSNGVREIMLASIANTEIRQALEKGLGTSPLHDMFSKELGISKDKAFIMHWTMLAWFWLHWGQYASTVTKKDIEELTGVIRLFYINPGVQLVWNNSPFAKPALENGFVDFVEGIITPQNINN